MDHPLLFEKNRQLFILKKGPQKGQISGKRNSRFWGGHGTAGQEPILWNYFSV
jgi:hypothetical protein